MPVERVTRVQETNEGQQLSLADRKEMKLSGVLDVLSFSDNVIELVTNMGMLTVKGEGLKLHSVSTESKLAEIYGRIDFLEYKKQKEAGSILKNLFR